MPETYIDKKGRKRFKETDELVSDWLSKQNVSRQSKRTETAEEEKRRLEQSKKSDRFSFKKDKDPKKHDSGVEFA